MRTYRPIAWLVASGAGLGLGAAAACTTFGSDDGPATSNEAGSALEAGAPEAAPDAAVDDDAAAVTAYCIAHAADHGLLFCDDLEMPAAAFAPFGFTDTAITAAVTTVEVTKDNPRPAVMKVVVNAPATEKHEVNVRQHLSSAGPPPSLTVDLDMKIVSINNVASTTLVDLHMAGGPCEASFGIGAFDGQTLGGTRSRDTPLRPLVTGVWAHVTITFEASAMSATGYRERTTYGGTTLVDRDAHASVAANPLVDCASVDLRVGIMESNANPAFVTVLYDNILVRKLPWLP